MYTIITSSHAIHTYLWCMLYFLTSLLWWRARSTSTLYLALNGIQIYSIIAHGLPLYNIYTQYRHNSPEKKLCMLLKLITFCNNYSTMDISLPDTIWLALIYAMHVAGCRLARYNTHCTTRGPPKPPKEHLQAFFNLWSYSKLRKNLHLVCFGLFLQVAPI